MCVHRFRPFRSSKLRVIPTTRSTGVCKCSRKLKDHNRLVYASSRLIDLQSGPIETKIVKLLIFRHSRLHKVPFKKMPNSAIQRRYHSTDLKHRRLISLIIQGFKTLFNCLVGNRMTGKVKIKELMEHASIVTTMRYIHTTDQRKRGAIVVLSEYRQSDVTM